MLVRVQRYLQGNVFVAAGAVSVAVLYCAVLSSAALLLVWCCDVLSAYGCVPLSFLFGVVLVRVL